MSRKVIHQRPKIGPAKKRIRARLKQIARDYNTPITIAIYCLLDFLEDGQIDGSLITTIGGGFL